MEKKIGIGDIVQFNKIVKGKIQGVVYGTKSINRQNT